MIVYIRDSESNFSHPIHRVWQGPVDFVLWDTTPLYYNVSPYSRQTASSTSFSHLHTSSKALFRKCQAEAPIARPAPAPPGELGCSPFSRSSSGQNKVSFQVPNNANSSTCSMMFLPLVESILSSSFFFFFPDVACHIFPPVFLSNSFVPKVCHRCFLTIVIALVTHGLTHYYIRILQHLTLSTRSHPQL